ncbi:type IV conjugative transfer system coupling protein TraD [Klebsiella pneumoniae]|uniref:type IV conjugative transfer system coupling protein TraD n=1 Tax=Klebsiella pneumoniae TaxID=573 RepID=UPI001D17FB0E|nr:type IV conjugative transfer system coupling protein TraD [Klebsiella pneumoniae]
MSLNSRDFTQGGQVLKYMIGMFLQIMNIATYYILMLSVLVFLGWLLIRMSFQQIWHGLCYWLIRYCVIPMREHSVNQEWSPYVFHFTKSTGEVIEFSRTAIQVMVDPYFIGVAMKLKDTAFWGWGLASFTFVGGILAVTWYLGAKGKKQRSDEILGGRDLVDDVNVVNKQLKKEGKYSPLNLSGLHFPKYSEMQNYALHGTVGSGKSTAINDFLAQIRAEGDRVIIYDKGNNFIPIFYRQDRDVLLNPMDKRCAAWNLWDECQSAVDFENFATTLLPDSGNGDPFWLLSARHLFVETARRLAKEGDRSIYTLLNKLLSITLADLREFLKGTDASNLVEGSIEKTAMTIRTVLTSYVRSLRYLQGLDDQGKRPFNLRDWIATEDPEGDNSWIFISSDGRNHNALKPLITAWLYMSMVNILGLTASRERRIWLFLDELPSLHKLPNLPEFCAEARKFGGCTFVAIQNFPQLRQIYGKDFAESIWDLLNTRFFYRAPSGPVAEFVETELGEKRIKKFRDQYSYGVDIIRDGVQFSKDDVRDKLVSYSDIQRLNDLQCYVTLPGDYPVVKLDLKRKEYRDIAIGHIPRGDDFLDPEVEKQLENASEDLIGNSSVILNRLFSSSRQEGESVLNVVNQPKHSRNNSQGPGEGESSENNAEAEGRGNNLNAEQAAQELPEDTDPVKNEVPAEEKLPERADETQINRRIEIGAELERW